MADANPSQSPFVPHDLKSPLVGRAGGPLAGVSVAVKDMYDIAGERVSGGSPSWLAHQSPAATHSAVVEQLLSVGATINHKTVCDEFFYSIAGANFHFGTPLNPKAPQRIPGGSSSGSASACASGLCDIAIGSDTGGSVRVPGSLCGIYGIRTTRGRMDLRGAMAMAPSFDSGGWFAQNAQTMTRAGKVLLLRWVDSAPEPARVSALTDMFANADAPVANLCRDFLKRASDKLPDQNEIVMAGDEVEAWRNALRITQAYEVWQSFGAFVSQQRPIFGPGVGERMQIAASVTADDVASCKSTLARVTERLEQLTDRHTILVLPTCPSIAPLRTATAEQLEEFRVRTMRMVCACSISGLPQITMPIGSVDGAPVGLSFIGWRNGEEALLRLASDLSRLT